MRHYLGFENSYNNPSFKEHYDDIKDFVNGLAGAKEMFDVRVYNEVRAMLRVHADRMQDEAEAELVAARTTSTSTSSGSGRSTELNGRTREFGADLAYGDGQSTPRTSVSSHPSKGGRKVIFEEENPYEDGELLVFKPILVEAAEENNNNRAAAREAGKVLITSGGTGRKGKRAAEEAADPDVPGKRTKTEKGGKKRKSPNAKKKTGKGDTTYKPIAEDDEEHEEGHKQAKKAKKKTGKGDKTYKPTTEDDEDEELEEEPRKQAQKVKKNTKVIKPGSGSLIPPEIIQFGADEQAPWTDDEEEGNLNPDKQFWPGDPVFMFGETKYLEALKSRQIELDLAPGMFGYTAYLGVLRVQELMFLCVQMMRRQKRR